MKIFFFILMVLGLIACKHRSYQMPTPSMAGTINVGDKVVVEESKDFYRNQLVVFNFYAEKVSKPTPYLKRIIAMPGDSLEIKDGTVFINDSLLPFPPKYHTGFILKAQQRLPKRFFEEQKISEPIEIEDNSYLVFISPVHAKELAKNPIVNSIAAEISPKGQKREDVFPQSPLFDWNPDNFGKLWIPKKDAIIEINEITLALYGKTILEKEEINNPKISDNKLIVNGKTVKKYRFKHNYYFMMGDNRHNSLDSRYWGFVSDADMIGFVLEEFLPE